MGRVRRVFGRGAGTTPRRAGRVALCAGNPRRRGARCGGVTTPLRFSVLDRSLVRSGGDAAEALRRTVRFAAEAERLG